MTENELHHWGIKGMRWGVRRTKKQLAIARGKIDSNEPPEQPTSKKVSGQTSSAKSDNDVEKSTTTEQPTIKELSERNARIKLEREYSNLMNDDDLEKVVKRLDLEKKYAELTKKEKSKGRQLIEKYLIDPAVDTVGKTVSDFVSKQISNLITSAMTKATEKKES